MVSDPARLVRLQSCLDKRMEFLDERGMEEGATDTEETSNEMPTVQFNLMIDEFSLSLDEKSQFLATKLMTPDFSLEGLGPKRRGACGG